MSQITLAIEASNPSSGGAGVALGEGHDASSARTLGVEMLRPSDRHDDDLVPAIERLVRRAGKRPRDVARVACSIGPGGYTGVRIAAATAKLIAEAVGAACIAVPTARVIARRVPAPHPPFGVALASKLDTAFVARFDSSGTESDPGSLRGAADLEALGIQWLIADRFLPVAFREEAARLGIEVRAPVFDPVACLEVSLAMAAIDPAAFAPLYPREPDAVTQWRQRKSGRHKA